MLAFIILVLLYQITETEEFPPQLYKKDVCINIVKI